MQHNPASFAVLLSMFLLPLAPVPGLAKDASFSADAAVTEDDRCVSTELFVFIKSGSLKSFKNKENIVAKGKIVLEIKQVNYCNDGAVVIQAVGKQQLKNGDLQFDGDLTSADLVTSLQIVDDNTKKRFDVDLHITWTGFDSEIQSTRDEEIDEPGHFVKIKKVNGRVGEQNMRLADAVVSLSSGGKNLISGDAEEATISILSKP